MKRFSLNLILVFLLAAFFVSIANADLTFYQSSMASDTRDSRRVGGLCFNMQGTEWPTLIMQGGVVEAGGGSTQGGVIAPFPFMFGKIATSASGSYQSDSANSVSNTLRYGTGVVSDLYITLTRLSPAMLLDTSATEVRLFGPDTQTDIDQIVATAMHFGGIIGNYSHSWWTGNNGVKNLARKGGVVKPLRWATRSGGQIYTGVLDTQSWPGMNSDYATRATSQAGTPATPPLDDLETEWLLLWYGADSTSIHSETPHVFPQEPYFSPRRPSPLWGVREQAYQADVAILLVPQNAPTNISHNSSNGIVFNFSSGMGKMAVLPLYGHRPLRAADTEQWLVSFPSAVATRCDQWADRLAQFPTNVSESVNYNSSQDKVTFTENVTFTTVRTGGQQQSPLPAMLGLAWHQGLPVAFSAGVTDTQLSTVYGQVVTVPGNSYTWTIEGLADYINCTEATGPSTSKSSPLEAELEAEVDKVIAAGPLSPFIFVQRMAGGYAHFTNPADGLYLLAELMPALSSAKQTQLTSYLANERSVRPPETILAINGSGNGPWGAMREPFDIFNCQGRNTSSAFKNTISPPLGSEPSPSLYRAYGLYRYYKITGQDPVAAGVITWCQSKLPTVLADQMWDTFGWYWGKYCWSNGWFKDKIWQQTPRCVNRDMAGLIGYLSLCELSSQTPDTDAWARLAKLAVLRYAMTTYGCYQAMAGMVGVTQHTATANALAKWADFSDPNNFVFVPMEINQYNVDLGNGAVPLVRPTFSYIFMDMVPEVGRMLKDWGAGSQVQKYLDRYAKRQANWYVAKADLVDGAEFNLRCIVDPHQMFMAHAWITGTDPNELERYINVSWMNRGDFYYMHKLAETIKAYRGVTWAKVALPVISPDGGGIYLNNVTVSITCATAGASIYYTLDGAEPTTSSSSYTGSFVLSANTVVKARAFAAGNQSATTRADFQINTSLPNAAPVVDAGQGGEITLPQSTFNLTGSVTDTTLPWPPGIVTLTWSKQSGPANVVFSPQGSAVTSAQFTVAGTYVLRLTADDGQLVAYDEVTVIVNPKPNYAPLVYAGNDQTLILPSNTATLDGSASDDGLPGPLTTLWTCERGVGQVSIADPCSLNTTATFSIAGAYILKLTATDGQLSASDEVVIVVNSANSAPQPVTVLNQSFELDNSGNPSAVKREYDQVLGWTVYERASVGLQAGVEYQSDASGLNQMAAYGMWSDSQQSGDKIYQMLTATIKAQDQFTLKFDAKGTSIGASVRAYLVYSYAGSFVTVANMSTGSLSSTYSEQTLVFTAEPGLGYIGKEIGVMFQFGPATTSLNRWSGIDNVRLEVAAVPVPGDFNGDGDLDLLDLADLAEMWLWSGASGAIKHDLQPDGTIDFSDYGIWSNFWQD